MNLRRVQSGAQSLIFVALVALVSVVIESTLLFFKLVDYRNISSLLLRVIIYSVSSIVVWVLVKIAYVPRRMI